LQLVGSGERRRWHFDRSDRGDSRGDQLNIVLSGNVEPLILLKGCRLGIGIAIGLGAGGLLKLTLKQSNFAPGIEKI